jgi:hypothetical protein
VDLLHLCADRGMSERVSLGASATSVQCTEDIEGALSLRTLISGRNGDHTSDEPQHGVETVAEEDSDARE